MTIEIVCEYIIHVLRIYWKFIVFVNSIVNKNNILIYNNLLIYIIIYLFIIAHYFTNYSKTEYGNKRSYPNGQLYCV